MGFLDEVQAARNGPGSKCAVGLALQEMKPADRSEVEAVLAMSGEQVAHAAIARALGARGVKVRANSIARHRNGECKCPSATK